MNNEEGTKETSQERKKERCKEILSEYKEVMFCKH